MARRGSSVVLLLLVASWVQALDSPTDIRTDRPTDGPADDLDIDLDAPNLADDDFEDMMDEDDVPVGPVHRHKWRTSNEGSVVHKGPAGPVFSLAPLPAPTKPTKLTKVEPTPGMGIGFYAPSRTLYRAPVPSTGRPPWPQGTAVVTAAPPSPASAAAWLAPKWKYAAAPPPPPFPTPYHPPSPPVSPPRVLQRQWHKPHHFVAPYIYQPRPYTPHRYPQPPSGMIMSMGK